MFHPNLGRFLQRDPIGFSAGDANDYRFVGNNPPTYTDPSGLFEYKIVSGPKFHGQGDSIGYEKLRLDIVYPAAGQGGRPKQGSFVQVNTITTIVVTCDNGTLKAAPTTVKYIPDRAKYLTGDTRFKDTLGGPDFDKKLAPTAILVFSHVLKEHGFTAENVPDITKSPSVSEKEAAALRQTFDPNYDKGQFDYSYLWVNADKGKGTDNLHDAILTAIAAADRPPVASLVKTLKLDLAKFNGQLVYGDGGLYETADLDGKPN